MSPPAATWSCPPFSLAAAGRLQHELGLSAVTAAILVRRGHATPVAARRFLAADDRHDPFLLEGLRATCERILGHVARGSRIVVHGDYDVDGICSTAVTVRALRRLGADPAWRLPSRLEDGYGLSAESVERLAAAGAGLLIAVDCGITAVAEVELARARGLDVVVCDHHRPGDRLPACPIVHPALGGYPFAELCATAVAHKLVEGLYATAGADPSVAMDDLDLVGLATVADVVPLVGENRRLVREGLRALGRTAKPGLRALMRVGAVDPGSVTPHLAGFRLAPRLNAAGRLQRADAALELVLTEDRQRADEVADELDALNRERREVERRILFAAEEARVVQADAPAYVLAGEGWHPGVIGIVASRMVERYGRPCALVALGPDGGRGSARSVDAYDLHAGLAACGEHLRRFGGHRMAAGFEIEESEIEAFRHALARHAGSLLSADEARVVHRVDAVVGADALGMGLADELELLGPFGRANPRPSLVVPAVRIADVRALGADGEHASFTLSGGGVRARVMAFRTRAATLPDAGDAPFDVVLELERSEWRGVVEPLLVLREALAVEAGTLERVGEPESFWTEVGHELGARRAPVAGARAQAVAGSGRALHDRRGEGFAGVLGSVLSTGDAVLVLCADVERRREPLERLFAGLAREGRGGASRLALTSWTAFARDPALGCAFPHLVALDPPAEAVGEALLAAAPADPGSAWAHLAWGPAERDYTLAAVRSELALDEPLRQVYRALAACPGRAARAHELEALLRGPGHGRSGAACGRLLRVLLELGVAALDAEARVCRLLDAPRTALDRSPAYRAYAAELATTTRYLTRACVPAPGVRAPASSAAAAPGPPGPASEPPARRGLAPTPAATPAPAPALAVTG